VTVEFSLVMFVNLYLCSIFFTLSRKLYSLRLKYSLQSMGKHLKIEILPKIIGNLPNIEIFTSKYG